MPCYGLWRTWEQWPDLGADWRAVSSVNGVFDGMLDIFEIRLQETGIFINQLHVLVWNVVCWLWFCFRLDG